MSKFTFDAAYLKDQFKSAVKSYFNPVQNFKEIEQSLKDLKAEAIKFVAEFKGK